MGFVLDPLAFETLLKQLNTDSLIYGPKLYKNGGVFADTDCCRYGKITSRADLVLDKKSEFSFKEILTPVSQTMFYFIEDEIKEASVQPQNIYIFLRSCDLHAVKVQDAIYLQNGQPDYYYAKIREKVKFILIGCPSSFENCFCVAMGTNKTDAYAFSVDLKNGNYYINCQNDELAPLCRQLATKEVPVTPSFVTTNTTSVHCPPAEKITRDIAQSKLWDEYNDRCLACGRCTLVCPTCTCFTIQDFFYSEDKKTGERRRIMSSCMIDGFSKTNSNNYRPQKSQRMRFKVLHKIKYFKEKFGFNMCVGCGRCDDTCPEYISFTECLKKIDDAISEVRK